jgi:hypothetical protein
MGAGCGDDDKTLGTGSPQTVSAPSTPTGSAAVAQGDTVLYSTSRPTSSVPDSFEYRFNFNAAGAHAYSPWQRDSTALHPWDLSGSFLVQAQARSATDPTAVSPWSSGLTVAVSPETISTSAIPAGPSASSTGTQDNYTAGGSVSVSGHPLQYRFLIQEVSGIVPDVTTAWGSTASLDYTWAAAGSYAVKAQARCAIHTAVTSAFSPELKVTVAPSGAPVVASAALTLNAYYDETPPVGEVPLVLHEVLGSWDEYGLTWNTKPPLSDSLAASTYSTTCFIGCLRTANLPVPNNLVQNWVDQSATNYGMAVGPGTFASGNIVFSDRQATAPYVPKLRVIWHYANETAMRAKFINMKGDTYVDETLPSSNFGSGYGLKAGHGIGDQVIFLQFEMALP